MVLSKTSQGHGAGQGPGSRSLEQELSSYSKWNSTTKLQLGRFLRVGAPMISEQGTDL